MRITAVEDDPAHEGGAVDGPPSGVKKARRRVELRQLLFARAAVVGVGLVASAWLLAGLSYAFTNSTFDFGNLVASKAAFASAWVPDAEQIGDADGVRGWLTDTLTDIVENPLRDGHARVMSATVRIRAD